MTFIATGTFDIELVGNEVMGSLLFQPLLRANVAEAASADPTPAKDVASGVRRTSPYARISAVKRASGSVWAHRLRSYPLGLYPADARSSAALGEQDGSGLLPIAAKLEEEREEAGELIQ